MEKGRLSISKYALSKDSELFKKINEMITNNSITLEKEDSDYLHYIGDKNAIRRFYGVEQVQNESK